MASVSTTTAATWVKNNWDPIDVLAQEEKVLAGLISQRQKAQGQLTVPFMSTVTPSSATAGSMSGQSLTYSAPTEGSATLLPTPYYAAYEVDLPLLVRAVEDPQGKMQRNLRGAIVAVQDSTAASKVASLTNNLVSAAGGIDKASILAAIKAGASGGKSLWSPRNGSGAFCVVDVSQIDNFLNVSEIVSAQIRGDRANPAVSGWAATAYGIDFYESGNIYKTGGNAYNVMCLPDAFGFSTNQKETVMLQEFGMCVRIIAWTDFATNIVRDQYAVQILSPAT